MTKEVFGRRYGDSHLLGDHGDDLFSLPVIDQARALGQSEACPVVERLVKPPAEGGRGAEVMRNRYGEVLFWFGYIRDVFTKFGHPWLTHYHVLSPNTWQQFSLMRLKVIV